MPASAVASAIAVAVSALTAAPSPSADDGEGEEEETASRPVGGAMLEGAEAGNGGEERGAKKAHTLARGAATPPGAFKPKELFVRSSSYFKIHVHVAPIDIIAHILSLIHQLISISYSYAWRPSAPMKCALCPLPELY